MIKRLPNWLMHRARWLAMAWVTLALSITAMQPVQAQISQTPLLTQSGSVEPNLVLMFDDSRSMYAQFLYQYGGDANGYGRTGPGVNAAQAAPGDCLISNGGMSCSTAPSGTASITVTNAYNPPQSTWYFEMSPDVNGVYYNPKVLYTPRVDATGTFSIPGATSNTAFNVYFYKNGSGVNVTWPGTTQSAAFPTPTLVTSYFSATTPYVPAAALLATGATTGLSYPTSVATGTGPFPKFLSRTDCNAGLAGGSCSLAEERQNYANWRKYHSNRTDLAKTGLGFAFQNLTSTIRVGWATISKLNGSSGTLDSGVGLYNQTQKNAFYDWLYSRPLVSGTPNRAVLANTGNYYSRADNKGPWATNPDTASTGITQLTNSQAGDTTAIRAAHLSCRRSYSMLVTDGYYDTTDLPTISIGNIDGTSATTITGTTAAGASQSFAYNGTLKPYADSQSDTMSDVAMKYWITDLRPDLPNNVKTITASVVAGVTTTYGNESFWQNMSFYAVGLGLNGTLAQTTTTRAQLTSGVTAWPTATAADVTTIDDMWHATINARGRMLSAGNSGALNDAVGGMLSEINAQTSSQAGVAASTASLKTGTKKYTPKYTTGTWIGDVVATNLDASSGADLSVSWQVTGTDPSTTIAYNGIPASGSRNVYAWNGSAMGSFDYASNPYVQANVVGANTNLINYLRGDQTNEGGNGTAQYRIREKLLGDIVNSSPVFVKGDLDMSYDGLPANTYGQSTYRTFVNTKLARSEGVLFAGANDGMLHGFRDGTGAEAFAFVPRAVMPNMNLLASKSYAHQYYVDGPLVEADACLTGGSVCSTWSNLLLGTLGAGGKSVFAIDVTGITPSTPTMGLSASSVKWEITTATTGYTNLGNILSDVQTGLSASGQWVAVFGNGFYGADGIARLYVADLDTGALIREISTTVGGTATASLNGLGGVRLVLDANRRIQGAYAGDLQGNLWKFDMSNATASSWALGLSGSPLYKGTSTKSITAPPNVVTNTSGVRVVNFGTGKLFDATDVSTTATQTLYGIQDSVAFGSSTTPAGITQTGTTILVMQTLSSVITATQVITNSNLTTYTVTVSYYAVSSNPQTTTSRGWYLNLPNTGQRMTNPISSLVGSYVLFDTLSPTNVSLDPCIQTGTGLAWNYVIDGATGSGPTSNIFDTNGDGIITSADLIVSGYGNTADGRTRVIVNDAKTTSISTYFTPLSTQQQPGFVITCAMAGTCNTCTTPSAFCSCTNGICTVISGTVTNVIKRNWRQLFLR